MRQDLDEEETLKCITEHPGFRPVCLEKWSLRLAASKYKTKAKQQYTQKGDEDRLVNISQLIYVRLLIVMQLTMVSPLPPSGPSFPC